MRQCARQGGFSYLALIFIVAIIGLAGAAGLKVGSVLQRAAAEEELLFIGAAYSDALQSYAAATPKGQPSQPPTLQALLKDPRFPGVRRHLRKIFVDPITGKAEWGVLYLGDKVGVIGVYSLSNARPLKVGNFDQRFVGFDNKEKLSDWKFVVNGQSLAGKTDMTGAPLAPPAQITPLIPPAPAPEAASAPASASASASASTPAPASAPASAAASASASASASMPAPASAPASASEAASTPALEAPPERPAEPPTEPAAEAADPAEPKPPVTPPPPEAKKNER